MKKRAIIIGSIVFISLLLIVLIVYFLFGPKVNMKSVTSGEAYINNTNKSDITEEDLEAIKDIFNGKRLYHGLGGMGWGFLEGYEICFNDGSTFILPKSLEPKIYWEEKNRYFSISDSENKKLRLIMKKYGFNYSSSLDK